MSEMTENSIIYIFFVMSLFLATGSSIVIYEKAAKDIWAGFFQKKCFFIIGAVRLIIGIVEIAIINASPTEYGRNHENFSRLFSINGFCNGFINKSKARKRINYIFSDYIVIYNNKSVDGVYSWKHNFEYKFNLCGYRN